MKQTWPIRSILFHASINKWLNYQKSDIYMSFGMYMKISCEQPNKMFSVQQWHLVEQNHPSQLGGLDLTFSDE